MRLTTETSNILRAAKLKATLIANEVVEATTSSQVEGLVGGLLAKKRKGTAKMALASCVAVV